MSSGRGVEFRNGCGGLDAAERGRLAELEAVVERGFVEVGLALAEIRDSRLYRATHSTFEAYLDDRWHMSRSRGYRQIDAAEVAGLLSPMGHIPNERQARELVPLLRSQGERAVVERWQELRDEYGDGVTAEKMRAARLGPRGRLRDGASDEWYTPAEYVDVAREVFGGVIDLDPASCAKAQEVVQATRHYTVEEDGLSQDWFRNVFLNPPYSVVAAFVEKALAEYESGRVQAAILLLNGYSFETRWFRPLWDRTLCFTYKRIRFYSPTRTTVAMSPTGSVFAYLGPDDERFAEVFQPLGAVVVRHPATVAA